MYALPTCPGILESGTDTHLVEVHEILDPSVLPILDDFEEFYPERPKASRFLRQSVWVPELEVDAWVYYLADEALPDSAPIVEDESWAQYVARMGKVLPADLPPNTYLHEFNG